MKVTKKMELIETHSNNLLISVPTRFIRDWITSRYLDSVIEVIKSHNKNINRIEFKINSQQKVLIDQKLKKIKTTLLMRMWHLSKIHSYNIIE